METKIDRYGILLIVVTAIFCAFAIVFAHTEPSEAEPTPTATAEPTLTSTPLPTVTSENTPISTPFPTTTPIAHITLTECLIADNSELYDEVLKSVGIQAEEIICLQTTWSNGDIVLVVMAKINGKWEIVEKSNG